MLEGAAAAAVGGNPLDSDGLPRSLQQHRDPFLTSGVLQTLAGLFKCGHREKLLRFIPDVLPHLGCLASGSVSQGQTQIRKLKMKLLQRIGLAFLPPRTATWRYQRGQRSLLQNLSLARYAGKKLYIAFKRLPRLAERQIPWPVSCFLTSNSDLGESRRLLAEPPATGAEAEEEELDVPEELEEIVEHLLCGLRDRDTVVRWSAAKGASATGRRWVFFRRVGSPCLKSCCRCPQVLAGSPRTCLEI